MSWLNFSFFLSKTKQYVYKNICDVVLERIPRILSKFFSHARVNDLIVCILRVNKKY